MASALAGETALAFPPMLQVRSGEGEAALALMALLALLAPIIEQAIHQVAVIVAEIAPWPCPAQSCNLAHQKDFCFGN
jgi:hypothetical protein